MNVMASFRGDTVVIGRNLRWAALAFLLWSLAYNLTGPLLPLYARELGAGPVGVGLVGSAGTLGSLLLVVPLSLLADWAGRRTALLAGWTMGAAGTFLMWAAPSWQALLPGSFFSMAPTAALPAMNALGLEELPDSGRARGFALLYGASPLGSLAGSAVAGLLGAGYGLRATTAVAGISVLAATLALLPIRTSGDRPGAGAPAEPGPVAAGTAPAPGGWALKLGLAALAAIGIMLLSLPGNFFVPYLQDVAHTGLVAAGLLTALLFGAQFGWSLLFAAWPRSTGRVRVGAGPGALTLSRATLLGLVACLTVDGMAGLLFPAGLGGVILLALMLRGSHFALSSLGSALLGDLVPPGPRLTLRITLFAGILGVGMAVSPVIGGWLYGLAPAYPFRAAGAGGLASAAVLLAIMRLLPRTHSDD